VTAIAHKGVKLWRFDNRISDFLAYFHCACAETAIWQLPVKNLTSPFASSTPVKILNYIVILTPNAAKHKVNRNCLINNAAGLYAAAVNIQLCSVMANGKSR